MSSLTHRGGCTRNEDFLPATTTTGNLQRDRNDNVHDGVGVTFHGGNFGGDENADMKWPPQQGCSDIFRNGRETLQTIQGGKMQPPAQARNDNLGQPVHDGGMRPAAQENTVKLTKQDHALEKIPQADDLVPKPHAVEQDSTAADLAEQITPMDFVTFEEDDDSAIPLSSTDVVGLVEMIENECGDLEGLGAHRMRYLWKVIEESELFNDPNFMDEWSQELRLPFRSRSHIADDNLALVAGTILEIVRVCKIVYSFSQ